MSDLNFSWQFDPHIFDRLNNTMGMTNSNDLSTNLTSFARNTVKEIQGIHVQGAKPGSTLPAADVESFPELLALIVNKKQDFEGTLPRDRIEVREKFVDIRPERDVIGWCLKSRRPGLFARGTIGDKKTVERSLHLRAVYDDIHNPGHVIAAYGQAMDNWIELCVMSSDASSANRRAIWLEKTIDESKWLFQYSGFQRVMFDERKEDEFKDINSNPCYMRPLIYYVRTEKIVLYRVALLRKLIFDLCVVPSGSDPKDAAKFSSVLKQ